MGWTGASDYRRLVFASKESTPTLTVGAATIFTLGPFNLALGGAGAYGDKNGELELNLDFSGSLNTATDYMRVLRYADKTNDVGGYLYDQWDDALPINLFGPANGTNQIRRQPPIRLYPAMALEIFINAGATVTLRSDIALYLR